MVFWMAILFGGLFAWLAVRLGFYETWILLFNILISVYLGIFLALRVSAFAPGTEETSAYGIGLSMIVIAGGCFAILQGLSFVFLTGQFKIRFPQVFDIVGAGALGFLAGFVILSFVALVITTTPDGPFRRSQPRGAERHHHLPGPLLRPDPFAGNVLAGRERHAGRRRPPAGQPSAHRPERRATGPGRTTLRHRTGSR
jgi:hypothetical protein